METQSSLLHFWSVHGYFTRLSNGLEKLYSFLFENRLDEVSTFDLLLLYSFVVIFLAFLIASAFAIFEQDQRSLQEIKSKVKFSSAAVANLATALWAIRETKFKSISYEGYIRIVQNKRSMMDLQKSPTEVNMPDVEISTNETTTKKPIRKSRATIKRDYSPLVAQRVAMLPKLGKVLAPQLRKPSGMLNASAKNNRCLLRTTPSASSVRLKASNSKSLIKKSQPVSMPDKAAVGFGAPRFGRKAVQIDDAVKVI